MTNSHNNIPYPPGQGLQIPYPPPQPKCIGIGIGLCAAGPGRLDTRKEYLIVTLVNITSTRNSTSFNSEFTIKANSKIEAYQEIKNRIPGMIDSLKSLDSCKPDFEHSISIVLCEEIL